MSSPSVLVTGGNSGVGKDLVHFFSPNSKSISRQTGHHLGIHNDKIIEESLDFDIFINFAHNGHFNGQVELLYYLHEKWKEKNKSGYIINMGSYSSYNIGKKIKRFASIKFSLDLANRQCCKEIEEEGLPFRMTNIRPGMLDTPKSREKQHWGGVGVKGEEIGKLVKYLYESPKDLLIPEITMASIKLKS